MPSRSPFAIAFTFLLFMAAAAHGGQFAATSAGGSENRYIVQLSDSPQGGLKAAGSSTAEPSIANA